MKQRFGGKSVKDCMGVQALPARLPATAALINLWQGMAMAMQLQQQAWQQRRQASSYVIMSAHSVCRCKMQGWAPTSSLYGLC